MSDLRKWISLVQNLNEGSDDADHQEALEKTGFWGSQGSGCLILARDTGRFLLCHRSAHVEQPGTWGNWGGAIDSNEDPAEAAKREVNEETGYTGAVTLEPMYVFKKDSFRYYNFLAIVDQEFTPKMDWESQGFKWTDYGKWPSPLHFGLISLFKDPASAEKMKTLSNEFKKNADTF